MDKIISNNRKALLDYKVHQKWEAGVELLGWEVKSLRMYGISLRNSFCTIKDGECWWLQSNMKSPLPHITQDTNRLRKLLLHKSQIRKIYGEMTRNPYTIIPLECYFKEGRYFKLLIALCSKETKYDKREKIRKREMEREKERY